MPVIQASSHGASARGLSRKACSAVAAILASIPACSGGGSSQPTPQPVAAPPPAPPPPAASAPESEAGIIYGSGLLEDGSADLLLDIYQPGGECTDPRPFVVGIHGGGFTSGSRRQSNWIANMEAITERGFVGMSIDYRLVGDRPAVSGEFQLLLDDLNTEADRLGIDVDRDVLNAATAAFEDATAALEWAADNADERCLDMSRFAIWGSSAGAVTALHVAYGLDEYSIDRPEPLVVIDYWGRMPLRGQISAEDAPLMIIHGTNDATVSYNEATILATEAEAAGLAHSFYTIDGGPHGFSNIDPSRVQINGQSALDVTLDFIADHFSGDDPLYETQTVVRN